MQMRKVDTHRLGVGHGVLVGRGFALIFGAFLGLAVGRSACAEEDAARAIVDNLHEALQGVMREGADLGFEGRRAQLEPVIKRDFDLPFITSVVAGKEWDSLTADQRRLMIDTFTRLTVATYASRFDEYSGEEFKTVEVRPLKKQRVMVRSELQESDQDVVQLDYVLHQTDEGWRIINVIADGVSDLSIKRADYTSVLKSSGFDALISRLNEQIESFAASS